MGRPRRRQPGRKAQPCRDGWHGYGYLTGKREPSEAMPTDETSSDWLMQEARMERWEREACEMMVQGWVWRG